VGTCQAAPTTVGCADFCAKLAACGSSFTPAQCDQLCAGLNDACKSCVLNANCPELMKEPPACAAECGYAG